MSYLTFLTAIFIDRLTTEGSDMTKIVCDMGESFGHWKMGHDEAVMPFIDIACIACGFHAGDPDVMAKTIKLAVKHQVAIGAHPGYPDKQGFGRRSIRLTPEQIENLVGYQLGALSQLSHQQGTSVQYLKPHGALYHDMLKIKDIFKAILKVAAENDHKLVLIGQFSVEQQAMAVAHNVPLYIESFADRAYQDDGKLVPRTQEHAVLNDSQAILKQLDDLHHRHTVTSENNKMITINSDSICIHGDNLASIEAIRLWSNRK